MEEWRIWRIFWKENQQDFLMDWVWSTREKEESGVTPGVLAWTTRSMELAFTEMEKSEISAEFKKKNFFFSLWREWDWEFNFRC